MPCPERVMRGTSRNRVPTRLVGARGPQNMHSASHVQLAPGETIVEEHVDAAPVTKASTSSKIMGTCTSPVWSAEVAVAVEKAVTAAGPASSILARLAVLQVVSASAFHRMAGYTPSTCSGTQSGMNVPPLVTTTPGQRSRHSRRLGKAAHRLCSVAMTTT